MGAKRIPIVKPKAKDTQDPPPPRWGVRTPQVQPTLKKHGGKMGSSLTPRKG
jgi:hypothetical protein